MNAQYQHEPRVLINQYHREAIQAEQLRTARGDQPGRIAALVTGLIASITAMVAAVGGRGHHDPGAHQEPVTHVEPVEEPVKTVVLA